MSLPLQVYNCMGLEKPHELGSEPRICDPCLNYLNSCRLLVQTSRNIEDRTINSFSASHEANMHIHFIERVHELSLEDMYRYVKRFEAITATFSIMYHTRIVKERADPKVIQDSIGFSNAVKEQQLLQRPKKEKKQLDDREKAILALTSVGVPRVVAEKSVDEKFKEQGKVTA